MSYPIDFLRLFHRFSTTKGCLDRNSILILFQYLWKKTGLDGKAPIPWAHAGLSQEDQSSSEAKHLARMKSFYSKVPRDTLLRIYKAYKLDYELFDYDFNQVLTLAGYDPI